MWVNLSISFFKAESIRTLILPIMVAYKQYAYKCMDKKCKDIHKEKQLATFWSLGQQSDFLQILNFPS